MRMSASKRLLQCAVALGGCVPVGAGLSGVVFGPAMVPAMGLTPVSFDSHFHYLSGLLLGIGLGFWSAIPQIEEKTHRFQALAFVVFIGGLARMVSWYVSGPPDHSMQFGLMMEVVVTPLLACWQYAIVKPILTIDRRQT